MAYTKWLFHTRKMDHVELRGDGTLPVIVKGNAEVVGEQSHVSRTP